MRKLCALLPVLMLVVSCRQPSEQLLNARAELDTQQQRWRAVDLTDYRFTFERSCFCPPEFNPKVTITVEDKAVASVHDTQSGELLTDPPYSYTIDDLFTIIQEALDKGVAKVSVRYSAQLGYPTDVYIDTYANAIDEEYSIKVREFTELTIGKQ